MSSQEFLKKEFSEENILFWQACEYFSHVPATDKKQVSPQYAATDEVTTFLVLVDPVVHCKLADHDTL